MTAGRAGEKVKPRKRRTLVAMLLGGLALSTGAIAWGLSGHSDASGPLGCIGDEWERGEDVLDGSCERGRALKLPVGVAISPDGRSVYVASEESDAVAILDREPKGGALVQRRDARGCVSASGTKGACRKGRALKTPTGVAISPDGRNVYVSSQDSNAIAIFNRNLDTGALAQKRGSAGCISERGAGDGCRIGHALKHPNALAISPDGRSLYVVSGGSSAIAILDRDPISGALTQKRGAGGCLSKRGPGGGCRQGKALASPFDVVVSPDGRSVYVVSGESHAIAIFDRNRGTGALTQSHGLSGCVAEGGAHGACREARTLAEPTGIAVSPDRRSVYISSGSVAPYTDASNSLAIFNRDRETGALAQKPGRAGCASETGSNGACQHARGLDGADAVALSPNGRNVYVTGKYADALTIFDRDQTTGGLTQKAGNTGCIGVERKGCLRTVLLLGLPTDLAISPDGRNVYVAVPTFEGLILTFKRSPATGRLSTEVRGLADNE